MIIGTKWRIASVCWIGYQCYLSYDAGRKAYSVQVHPITREDGIFTTTLPFSGKGVVLANHPDFKRRSKTSDAQASVRAHQLSEDIVVALEAAGRVERSITGAVI